MNYDDSGLERAVERLNEAVRVMKRNNAMMAMQMPHNPYRKLIRVMVKLDLIKDWLELVDLHELNIART